MNLQSTQLNSSVDAAIGLTYLVARACLTNRGVQKFEAEINSQLKAGSSLLSLSIEPKGFRIVCAALLAKKA